MPARTCAFSGQVRTTCVPAAAGSSATDAVAGPPTTAPGRAAEAEPGWNTSASGRMADTTNPGRPETGWSDRARRRDRRAAWFAIAGRPGREDEVLADGAAGGGGPGVNGADHGGGRRAFRVGRMRHRVLAVLAHAARHAALEIVRAPGVRAVGGAGARIARRCRSSDLGRTDRPRALDVRPRAADTVLRRGDADGRVDVLRGDADWRDPRFEAVRAVKGWKVGEE